MKGESCPDKIRERARKGKAASPWSRGPHCETPNAMRKFRAAKNEGK